MTLYPLFRVTRQLQTVRTTTLPPRKAANMAREVTLPTSGSADDGEFYVCSCFFTNNFYLKDYNVHVVYRDDVQFGEEYKQVMNKYGCGTDEQWNQVLAQVKSELERRHNLFQQSLEKSRQIRTQYRPLHPQVYTLQKSFFAPEFLEFVELSRRIDTTPEDVMKFVTSKPDNRVYEFPVFTEHFCQLFMEEITHFEDSNLPKGRPNTMNNYGILLNELGFDEGFITPLRTDYLRPICRLLYPDWGGDALDSHKAFVVTYKLGEDLDLSYHYDNAEVTLNVSLGKDFEEGSLYFGNMRQVVQSQPSYREHKHRPTYGLLHRGQHKHGAMPIDEGERYNLIIWMRSSKVRNQLCPMCDQKPTLVRTVGFGDGFTKETKTVDVCCAS
ncbi:2-oxoglutarate and iron-dependent oxygenase domain-containing protein 2-like [Branchiostoma floridae]|uniref:2-oxoglutarate and iron-dependent oxygenase domain-containing protein 2-like n=2 Tax=Branchiostoma floridae TaxID=7739 RepID=A0A9J7M007_BRAFL|nr:2-oxoglutarate and iron-dependent oxygenase domain-containing protein 2-like [Branchiostoma floridae]